MKKRKKRILLCGLTTSAAILSTAVFSFLPSFLTTKKQSSPSLNQESFSFNNQSRFYQPSRPTLVSEGIQYLYNSATQSFSVIGIERVSRQKRYEIQPTIFYNGRSVPVTSIINLELRGKSYVEEFIIPSSIAEISGVAISDMPNLKELIFPAQAKLWLKPQMIFPNKPNFFITNCPQLERVILPEDGGWFMFDGLVLFNNCPKLTEVKLPTKNFNKLYTQFAYPIFSNCPLLKTIIIPPSITDIGAGVFSSTKENLYATSITDLYIPTTTTWKVSSFTSSIATNIHFYNPNDYISHTTPPPVLIPSNLNSRQRNLSSILSQLKNSGDVIIPQDFILSTSEFEKVWQLKSITLNAPQTKIPNSCFAQTNLEKIYVPSNIKEIEDYAFMNCRNLHDISFAEGVQIIGQSVFKDCDSLEHLVFPASLETYDELPASLTSLSFKTGSQIPNTILLKLPPNLDSQKVIPNFGTIYFDSKAPILLSTKTDFNLHAIDLKYNYLWMMKNIFAKLESNIKFSNPDFVMHDKLLTLHKITTQEAIFLLRYRETPNGVWKQRFITNPISYNLLTIPTDIFDNNLLILDNQKIDKYKILTLIKKHYFSLPNDYFSIPKTVRENIDSVDCDVEIIGEKLIIKNINITVNNDKIVFAYDSIIDIKKVSKTVLPLDVLWNEISKFGYYYSPHKWNQEFLYSFLNSKLAPYNISVANVASATSYNNIGKAAFRVSLNSQLGYETTNLTQNPNISFLPGSIITVDNIDLSLTPPPKTIFKNNFISAKDFNFKRIFNSNLYFLEDWNNPEQLAIMKNLLFSDINLNPSSWFSSPPPELNISLEFKNVFVDSIIFNISYNSYTGIENITERQSSEISIRLFATPSKNEISESVNSVLSTIEYSLNNEYQAAKVGAFAFNKILYSLPYSHQPKNSENVVTMFTPDMFDVYMMDNNYYSLSINSLANSALEKFTFNLNKTNLEPSNSSPTSTFKLWHIIALAVSVPVLAISIILFSFSLKNKNSHK